MTPQRHGSVRLQPTHDSGPLADAKTLQLAEELLTRVRAGENLTELPRKGRMLGALSQELALRLDHLMNRYSRERARLLLAQLRQHAEFSIESLRHGTLVELGAGALHPFAGLMVPYLLGCPRAVAIDLEELEPQNAAAHALYQCVCEMLASPKLFAPGLDASRDTIQQQAADLDLDALRDGDISGIPSHRLEFRRAPANGTSLSDDEAQIVTSNSFLEHVHDIDAVLAEMARITRPGGLGYHTIDGADHRKYRDPSVHPLEFLTIEVEDNRASGCNRIRPLAYRPLFEQHGFEVLDVVAKNRTEVPDSIRVRLVEPFASMSDDELGIVQAAFHLRKR